MLFFVSPSEDYTCLMLWLGHSTPATAPTYNEGEFHPKAAVPAASAAALTGGRGPRKRGKGAKEGGGGLNAVVDFVAHFPIRHQLENNALSPPGVGSVLVDKVEARKVVGLEMIVEVHDREEEEDEAQGYRQLSHFFLHRSK